MIDRPARRRRPQGRGGSSERPVRIGAPALFPGTVNQPFTVCSGVTMAHGALAA